ncbi:MAG: pilus assembly protein PilM [Planctomycetota bacterium]|jgi:type IV pilus assembly protein PilM|nr:pilus assembly protein PilM [Planctomycetota bacterium]
MVGWGSKKRLLGLDIGSYGVKAVEITCRGDQLLVSGYAQAPVTRPNDYPAAIRAVLASGGLQAKRVVVGISGGGTVVKTINCPGSGEGDLGMRMWDAAEKDLGIKPDGLVFDYQVEEEKGAGVERAVVALAKQSEIALRVEILKKVGIFPEMIVPELVALANAYEIANAGAFFHNAREGVIMVDFGASKTLLYAVAGVERLFREHHLGGNALSELVANRLGVNLDAGENTKCEPGDKTDVVLDAIYPALEDLATLIRSLSEGLVALTGIKPGLLLISGGMAIFPGLPSLLTRLTEIPAKVFDSFGAVETKQSDPDFLKACGQELIVAFGLATLVKN